MLIINIIDQKTIPQESTDLEGNEPALFRKYGEQSEVLLQSTLQEVK